MCNRFYEAWLSCVTQMASGAPSWHAAAPTTWEWCRYLLLIDQDTGDVLTLLLYTHELFGTNYSRKLATLKYSAVTLPPDCDELNCGDSGLYWTQAFESPRHIKTLVKQAMPDLPVSQVMH